MKVYVVTSGQYSDYGICGIFSTKENAQQFISDRRELHKNDEYWYDEFNDIDEYEVDQLNKLANLRYKSFIGSMDVDGNILDIQVCKEDVDEAVNYFNIINNELRFEIVARSQEHAVKTAKNKRVQFILNNMFNRRGNYHESEIVDLDEEINETVD